MSSDPRCGMRFVDCHPFGKDGPVVSLSFGGPVKLQRVEGIDFDVFYVNRPGEHGGLGIYFGSHPQRRSQNISQDAIQTVSRSVGTMGFEWHRWMQDRDFRSEAVVSGLFSASGDRRFQRTKVHLFITAPTEKDCKAWEFEAESIQLKTAKPSSPR